MADCYKTPDIRRIRKRVRRYTYLRQIIHITTYAIKARAVAWWRLKVTRRCCLTCGHWRPLEDLQGRAGHCDTRPVPNAYTGRPQPLLTLYTQHCKQWHKIPINSCEVPPSCTCNTTEK